MKDKIMSMKAVELMVSIDFKNRCATDKMIIKMDLRKIIERRLDLKRLKGAVFLLDKHAKRQEELGIIHFWVQDAFDVIKYYVGLEMERLDKEEEDAKSRLATLDRQIKEFDEKEKKRKKNAKKS